MKIKILGTRGEIKASKPYHSKHSGVLVDNTLLFDLGERQYLKLRPKHIFITHLHPDHAFFVRHNEKINKEVYTPRNFKREKKIGPYRIRPIPTFHSKKVASQAYLIQKGKKKLLYTGDMIWIKKKYHHYLKDIDLVITEGSFIRKGGMIRKDKVTKEIFGHNGMPELISLFKRFTRRIVFMHFGSWFYDDVAAARKKIKYLAKELDLTAAYDGYELKI
jgi:ribonuclease BN (tRNA processing enzyme)